MNKSCIYAYVLIILIGVPYISCAQTDSTDIYNMDFSQLSKMKITTASKVAEDADQISSTVFVITSSEIKENGYFTLEEALSTLPGFQFRNILGINSYIFQRGIPNQNNLTLLLIDGIQINELNSGGFYAGSQYNLSNVERIEVVHGPSSVAYGTNAVSGIINIITKTAYSNRLKMNALAGAFKTFSGDFNYTYVNNDNTFNAVFAGMFKTSNKADLKGKEGDYNWTDLMDNFEDDYSFDLKMQYKEFTFGTNFIQKQTPTTTQFKSLGTSYLDHGTFWNIRFINNYIKFSSNISNNISLTSVLYNRNATVLDNTVYYIVDTSQVGYYRPNNLTGFESVLNYEGDSFLRVTGGLTLEYEQLSEKNSSSYSHSPELKPPAPLTPRMLNNSLASVFIEPRFALTRSLLLTTGIRYDNSSSYDEVFTPRFGLSYNFLNNTFRLSYAEAFRAPKPWDYTDGIGNSSLLPERMKSLEGSIAFPIDENIHATLAAYSNKLEHAIVKETVGSEYKWINSGEVKTKGFEIFMRYLSSCVKSSISYTFTESLNELGGLVPEISKHTGNFSITYSFNQFVKFNFRADYIGRRENPKFIATTKSKYIEPNIVLNSTLSFFDYKGFDFHFIIKNLLNEEYYHSSNRDPDRYRQPQRSIMLSIGYSY